jgi:predicted ribosome quality control (RQC) complex YloA/Tae2 family protein
VVSELAPILAGQTLESLRQTLEGDLLLEFAGGERRERVRLGAGPGRSILYGLRGHPPLAETPTPFAAAVAAESTGARLEEIRKETDERVVLFRLRTGGGRRTLVAELLGRSANLLWLDAQERILAFARTLESEFRRPRAGEPYQPPPAGERPALASLTPRDLEDLERRAGPQAGALERELARGVRGLGAVVAREIEYRLRFGGQSMAGAWADIGARLRASLWDPRLYSPADPEGLQESVPLDPARFFVAPWELGCAADLVSRAFPTFSQALELHDRLLERWRRFERARRSLAASFGDEEGRLRRLRAALEDDLSRSADAERYRRWGDLLLRETAPLRLEGETAVIVDRYGEGGEERIPVDPRLGARQNAEAMFQRYKRARRAAPQIERRLREVDGRLERVCSLAERARAAAGLAELEELSERLKVAPRGAAQSRTLGAPQGEADGGAQAREYRSSEGWTILVGRGARANDRLTFSVGAPHDFWLHAAEVSGAHVLVRNPGRAPSLPPRTLEEAAGLAAWFSKARGATSVEVHYAQRRHLRRPRGAAPGLVLVKRFRTLRVRPRSPSSS